jgi:hypothetical protein
VRSIRAFSTFIAFWVAQLGIVTELVRGVTGNQSYRSSDSAILGFALIAVACTAAIEVWRSSVEQK